MSQPNQQQQSQSQSPRAQTLKIRMKPGCGRMLIGRKYKLIDDTIVARRPKTRDDIADVVDEYLEQGQVAEVTLEQIAALLGKDGKPARSVEGYRMRKIEGKLLTHDKQGNELPHPVQTEDTWTASNVVWQGNELIASHPDCPIEIVS